MRDEVRSRPLRATPGSGRARNARAHPRTHVNAMPHPVVRSRAKCCSASVALQGACIPSFVQCKAN